MFFSGLVDDLLCMGLLVLFPGLLLCVSCSQKRVCRVCK